MVPSLLSTIKEDKSFGVAGDRSVMATALPSILPMTSMTCLVGKLALGTITDRLGGSIILILVFGLFAGSSIGLILTTSSEVFGLMWVFNSLAYTSAWGAATQVIESAFPRDEWPTQISSIASAGRMGAAAGAIVYGSLLHRGYTWRQVFCAPAAVQLVLVILCIWQHITVKRIQATSTAADEAATSPVKLADKRAHAEAEAVQKSVWAQVLSTDFLLMFVPKCALFILTQWFMNFVGLFLPYAFGFTKAAATNAISVPNAGQMVALIYIGAGVYKRIGALRQAQVVTAMLLVNLLVPVMLRFRTYLPFVELLLLPILFLWGLSFAVPFYLPAGTFALELGGKRNGALFTNLFDAGGFTVCSVWNRFAAAKAGENDFNGILDSIIACAAIALLMPVSMYSRLPVAAAAKPKAA